MNSLAGASRDELLAELHLGVKNFSMLQKTENIIQLFEADPIMLDKHVPSLIDDLTSNYFQQSSSAKAAVGKIYYQFTKILGNKRVRIHLPSNIYDLSNLLELLSCETEWHTQYLILSWILMLVISPFKLENDYRILSVIANFEESLLLKPLVSQIRAELWAKNTKAIALPIALKEMEPIFLNSLLQVVKHTSEIPFSPKQLDALVSWLISIEEFQNEVQAKYILKLLPKLAHTMKRREETWPQIYDILFWLIFSLTLSFTDLRFQLAKSAAKILLLTKQRDEDSTRVVISDCLDDLILLLESNTNDAIDADRLHTSLLLVAEFSRRKLLAPVHIGLLSEKVIPVTSKFQQLRMNTLYGHQIRDATNFICWSLSREYNELNELSFETIFLNLLFSANFDPYPLVRKSAMAALQECLGRHGSVFLDNITLLRLVEIHVGNLSHAEDIYAIFRGKYMEYANKMIEWLLLHTIGNNEDFTQVKNATKFICELELQTKDENFSFRMTTNVVKMFQKSQFEKDHDLASKVLFLLCHRKGSINDEFNKSLSLLQEDTILRVWNTKVSFKMLSELHAIRYIILNGCQLTMVFARRIFKIIRYSPKKDDNYIEISTVFNQIIRHLSKNSQSFENNDLEIYFWGEFERLLRLEQPLISCSAPFLHYTKFISLFYDVIAKASCQFKSKIISSLRESLSDYPQSMQLKRFLSDMIVLSDDYTVTEQGDIGRLVRLEVVKLIFEHLPIFEDLELIDDITEKLLRLMGEPSTEIGHISFLILARISNFDHSDQSLNKNMIMLYKNHHLWRREFWIGYFFSVGAIHSTDKQVRLAVDELLNYYSELDSNSKLELTNELVRIIPQFSDFKKMSAGCNKNHMGAPLREKKMVAVTYVNAWYRLLESGYKVPSEFNFKGAFAKFYNLQLLSGSQSIKTHVLHLLPLLALSHRDTHDEYTSNQFTNQIINCLLKQSKPGMKDNNFGTIERTAIEALTHIYLRMNRTENVNKLLKYMEDPEKFDEMREDLSIT